MAPSSENRVPANGALTEVGPSIGISGDQSKNGPSGQVRWLGIESLDLGTAGHELPYLLKLNCMDRVTADKPALIGLSFFTSLLTKIYGKTDDKK